MPPGVGQAALPREQTLKTRNCIPCNPYQALPILPGNWLPASCLPGTFFRKLKTGNLKPPSLTFELKTCLPALLSCSVAEAMAQATEALRPHTAIALAVAQAATGRFSTKN